MKHARPPVKVQNERRMASFFVWMAWWCRAVLIHRTRWSFLESLPQPLPKGKGFGAALTGIFFWKSKKQRGKETKSQRDGETGSQRDGETERRGVKESKRRRDEESAQRLFDGFEQGLNRVCSMVVQWSFNGRSMVGVVFPGRRGNFLPRRGKFSPRRGKKSGCLVRRSDRVDFALV